MTRAEHVPLGRFLAPAGHVVELQPDKAYRIAGIYSFGKGLFERDSICGADTAYAALTMIQQDQFVVSKLNGWEGAVGVVTPELAGCLVSSEYPVFSIDRERAEPAYMRWIARWPSFWDRLVPRGSMVRRKRVQVSQLLDVTVPLPRLEEQRHISARLDAARGAGERIAQLSARSTSIAGALRTALTTRGAQPWPTVMLRDVLRIDIHTTAVDRTHSYDMAGVYSFGRGLFERERIEGTQTAYSTLHRLEPGQIVMSRLKAWEGALATVDSRFNGWYLSPEFPTFTADESAVDGRFLNAVVTSEPFWSKLASTSKGMGARRERVHAERLLDQAISLPPIAWQRVIAESIERAEYVRHARAANEAYLTALLPAMLNREFADLA